MDSDSITKLVIIVVLLLCSAFFSSAETALSRVSRVRLKLLADEGNKRAKKALKVIEDYGKMLSAVLIGNNIVNLSASALATAFAISINVNVGVATAILTVTVLLFCEIIPKNISAAKTEDIALAFAGMVGVIMKLLTPIIYIVDFVADTFMRLFGIDPDAKEIITEGELRSYLDESHEGGEIEDEEKEMIFNVFDFGDSVAKDIMIPRVDMVTIDKDDTYEDLMKIFRKHMYTRIPVYDQENDCIMGLINMKDIIALESLDDFDISKVMRQAYFTYEFRKTADLLADMRSKSESMAFVLNEYGTCEGMVTLEDLLEEIVGEIRDEYDADEEDQIQKMEEDTYLIEGTMKLDDINDELGTDLHSQDYDSIAGLIIENLEDRVPEDGETIVTEDGIRLMVHGVSQNRILKVIMKIQGQPEAEENEEEQ